MSSIRLFLTILSASNCLLCHLHLLTRSVDSSEGEEEIDPDAEEEEDEDEGEEELEEEEEEDMDMDLDSDEEAAKPAPKKPTKTTAAKRKPTAGTSLRNPYPLEGKYVDEDDREQYVLIRHAQCVELSLMIVYRHYRKLKGRIS
jgi:hypothetical protein